MGVLSKLRYYVHTNILIYLYYTLIYPFLIYGIIVWGNTYPSTIQPLFVLQKKAMRIITFSEYNEHSSPLSKLLNIIKIFDLVTFHIASFMYKFHHRLLPSAFDNFFTPIDRIHNYNTDWHQNRVITFLKQELIMVYSI